MGSLDLVVEFGDILPNVSTGDPHYFNLRRMTDLSIESYGRSLKFTSF